MSATARIDRLTPVPHKARSLALFRVLMPLGLGTAIALSPVPAGLTPAGWNYFALFAAAIAGIITEPIPAAAVGLISVVFAAALGMVHQSPADSAVWALSGFGNSTVWLTFAAFMLSMGYARTGLGRRLALQLIKVMGHSTLGLGYAVTLADVVLAPVTASSTARSGATVYPVIRQIPELYGSHPHEESARRIGAYLLYTAVAASTVTSSMFLTGMAPNVLALSLAGKVANVSISWSEWVVGFAPVGVVLILLLPSVLYKLFPPHIKHAPEAPAWAREQLRGMGPISSAEVKLLALVLTALALWIGGGSLIDPTIVAMLVVALMIVTRVVTWDQVMGNADGWNVLVWFATLLTLAGGLAETGFVRWIAESIAPLLSTLDRNTAIVCLVGSFYLLHYFFASITAHTATLFSMFLAVAIQTGTASAAAWTLLLGYSLGMMGILTPYASGQNAVYYGSGYITRKQFWALGFVVGTLFLATYLVIIIPWLTWLGI